jgi:hypothetical protein
MLGNSLTWWIAVGLNSLVVHQILLATEALEGVR